MGAKIRFLKGKKYLKQSFKR